MWHANFRIVTLDCHRYAGDQSTSANPHDHGVNLKPVLDDLQSKSALASDDLFGIKKGVHMLVLLHAPALWPFHWLHPRSYRAARLRRPRVDCGSMINSYDG